MKQGHVDIWWISYHRFQKENIVLEIPMFRFHSWFLQEAFCCFECHDLNLNSRSLSKNDCDPQADDEWKSSGKKKDNYTRSLTARPWKIALGRLASFWEGLFSGAMLNFGRVTNAWRADAWGFFNTPKYQKKKDCSPKFGVISHFPPLCS